MQVASTNSTVFWFTAMTDEKFLLYLNASCSLSSHMPQASQLGVYKAFVDNYKVALETAEKCSQANIQFQKISEVSSSSKGAQRLKEQLERCKEV